MRPAVTAVLSAALLLMPAACARLPPSPTPTAPMPTAAPFVIAHRGASAYRPEHTLESYALAIEQGADAIEPDLVVTRDGVLICRHENEIGGTTDVATRAEFANRRTRKRIDGEDIEGWFAEDFTLAEIRTLRARERLPELRPASTRYDGAFAIPTFAEVIALAAAAPRPVAIYPETKHPTYFEFEGRHLDGTPIARSTSALLVADLVRSGFTDATRIYIQSFELANLIELRRHLLPQAGFDARLMQLFGDAASTATPRETFALPYDLHWHRAQGEDLDARYPQLRAPLPALGERQIGYADLATPEVLAWMRANYAFGIAPWKDNLLARRAEPGGEVRLTGQAAALIARAHVAGLQVHTYTLRAEAAYRVRDEHGALLSMEQEIARLLNAGVDGFFTDFPDRGAALRDAPD